MLSVTVRINGRQHLHVDVLNIGPPDGVDENALGQPRLYRWQSNTGETGELLHWRADGAAALAASVLRQLAVDVHEL